MAELKEGGLYRFRVRAVNAAGVGEPGVVSELIEVKDRTSKNEFESRDASPGISDRPDRVSY